MLIDRYPLYHSMDIEYVIERIIEEEKLEIPLKKSLDDILKDILSLFIILLTLYNKRSEKFILIVFLKSNKKR